jgi:hypothetical protein
VTGQSKWDGERISDCDRRAFERSNRMDRRFGYYIVLGLVVGVVFGMGVGAAIGNVLLGIGLGALGGVFIGWFIAAAALQSRGT